MAKPGNTVIIADDHPLIGVALRLSVQAADAAIDVLEVSTFAALKQTMEHIGKVQLVLLDLIMPDVEGLSALQFLREQYPQAPVAIISSVQEQSWLRAAKALGAVAFLPKSTDTKLLPGIIRQLLDGGSWWPTSSEPISIDVAEMDEQLKRLTPQELRILLQIKDGRNNKQIANDLAISESTVKTHISKLLLKLNLRSRTQVAVLTQRLFNPHQGQTPKSPTGKTGAE